MLIRDVAYKLHNKHGLADTCAAEQTDFAALCVRGEQVDDLYAGLQHLGRGADIGEGRRVAVNGHALFGVDRTLAVYRLTDDVEHTPQRRLADGHGDGRTRVRCGRAAGDAVRRGKRNAAHRALADLLHDLKRDLAAVFVRDLYRVV